jgi:RHS repeat-associated protein
MVFLLLWTNLAFADFPRQANNALVQTFTVNPLNEISNVTRTGTLTVSGALPAPASSVTVNGVAAQTNGDFTFASTNNTLANGTNTFTIIAKNAYNVAVTNTLSVTLPATVSFQYDANGNLTNDGTRSFAYDAENRLTNVTVTSQYQVTFTYDGLSRCRIMTNYAWLSGTWTVTNVTRYIYDGLLVLQERNTNNAAVATYTRGLDLSTSLAGAGGIGGMLARTDTNSTTFYHSDGNGNITAITDTNANVVARSEYDAYGKMLASTGPMAGVNHYWFSSKEYIPAAGLYDFGGRFEDPNLSRWLNRDPIQERGGINLYTAMRNNPLRWVDPHGLDGIDPLEQAMEDMDTSEDPSVTQGAAITQSLVNSAWTGYFAAMAQLAASEGLGAALGAIGDALGLGAAAEAVALETPKPPVKCPTTTVIGSGRDVAPYVGKPGFNTFTGEGIPPAELDTQNALWLNNAIQNGDQIWLVTDPEAHAALLQSLPGQPQSAYLNLELPMLNQYSGVNAIPTYATGAAR